MTLPLSDARTAGIGHDQGSNLLEVIEDSVTLGSIANLLRTRVDDKLTLYLDSLLVSLSGYTCRTGQVLIGRVGTATYQSHFNNHWIVVGRSLRLHVRDRSCCIRSKRTIEMWLHLREVDFYNLVVESSRIGKYLIVGTKLGSVLLGKRSNLLTTRLAEIFAGILVEWEDRTGSTQLCTHVTDGSLTRGRDAIQALAKVFEDGIGTTLHGEDAQDFENHILRSSPSGELACEMHTDEAWHLELPRLTCKHIHGIGTTNTHGYHTETAGVWGMGVSTHHHTSREGIVLKYHLMDDTSTWSPESDVIFLRYRLQKVIYLFISLACLRQVLCSTHVGTNQVIAMY